MSLIGLVLSLTLLTGLVSAKGHNMVELEGACAFNAHAVACARLTVLGCASALTLFACALLCASAQPLWLLAAHAAAPYFLSCAVLHSVTPVLLQAGSAGVWCVAAATSALWCVRETALWLRHAACPFEPARAWSAAL